MYPALSDRREVFQSTLFSSHVAVHCGMPAPSILVTLGWLSAGDQGDQRLLDFHNRDTYLRELKISFEFPWVWLRDHSKVTKKQSLCLWMAPTPVPSLQDGITLSKAGLSMLTLLETPSQIHMEVSSTHLQEILNPVRLMFTITWHTLVGHLRWTALENVWFKLLSQWLALSMVSGSKLGIFREVMKAAQVLSVRAFSAQGFFLHSINTSHIFGYPCSKLLAKTNPDKDVPYRPHCNSRVLPTDLRLVSKESAQSIVSNSKNCPLMWAN